MKIVEVYRPGDIIWINDYHLMLVPNMIRKIKPDAVIGFFLHIPFPSSEIFRCLHVRKDILEGLLGADMIGFQIYAFMRHFIMTCTRILGVDSTPKTILMEDSAVTIGSFPIGIDLETLSQKRDTEEVCKILELLQEKYRGKKVLIGRDKNDHVKGVRQKMLAFEMFLKNNSAWQGKVVLIQVSLSTSEVNEAESNIPVIVSRINSQFGSLEYVPVVYLPKNITFPHYLALLTVI
jgi:trehalose 6-phosphate synthase/phosphatase